MRDERLLWLIKRSQFTKLLLIQILGSPAFTPKYVRQNNQRGISLNSAENVSFLLL